MAKTKKQVLICHGTGCVSSNAPEIKKKLLKEVQRLSIGDIEIKLTGCHGFCQRGPIVTVEPEGIFYTEVKPLDAAEIVRSHLRDNDPVERLFYKDPLTGRPIAHYCDVPFYSGQKRTVVLRNCGHINPEKIEEYLAVGGYKALKQVLSAMKPKQIIEVLRRAGLRGRGGAGFPTAKKWEFCYNAQSADKYIICNADEGDPGAFMDRSVLEADPHSVIEGMIIAGFAIGAKEGFIYVRAEYPLAVKRIGIALQQAGEKGFLGKNISRSGFDFRIKVMEGAGAFVCGEETALIASIEGLSGRPRPRPPYPANSGLWGKPTTINNVKTLASVPVIISKGADWYSAIGTKGCKGTAVFALTGHIANCGLVEVAMGTTLREIIYHIGEGIPDGKKFKAVQTGGPSGGCLPASFLDYPVDYESLASAGSIMGSGGMVVMNEDTCMVDIARYFLDFTQRESCGKCIPCRLGTKQMLDILEDITKGKAEREDIDLLVELSEGIKSGSLCGLGQTAPNPVLTTIKYFRDEYEAHVTRKRCPAAVCKEIISSPCQHTCPIGTQAATYISLIAKKRYKEAFDVILMDNPLPSVCGRVCHHPCEAKCQAGKWAKPIAIRALKRFAADRAVKNKRPVPGKRKPVKKKHGKVAIIGAGPAGLMAAWHLAKKGYGVTIFEALNVAGGGLAAYIPEYRLPREMLKRDIENIKNVGVTIKTNIRVGKDISFKEISESFKAVFVSTGAGRSRKLGIPGEEAADVLDSMAFLREANLGKPLKVGKTVGVIGGGNAAIDAARVAYRMKECEKVIIIYRRTIEEMPAFKDEVAAALEEGIDIRFLKAPTKVMIKDGVMAGIECLQMKLGRPDESGRRRPVPIEGSESAIKFDTLISAIGETPNTVFLKDLPDIDISKWGSIIVDPETFSTNIKGIFAGGDVVTGPNTVIDAMSSGKIAAQMIDKYMSGEKVKREYKKTRPSRYLPAVELSDEEIETAARPVISVLAVNKRSKNFEEVDSGLTEEQAVKEARRCLRCDLETEDAKECFQKQKIKGVVSCG
jgi:NADH-quinone oxidoreductase subunit F